MDFFFGLGLSQNAPLLATLLLIHAGGRGTSLTPRARTAVTTRRVLAVGSDLLLLGYATTGHPLTRLSCLRLHYLARFLGMDFFGPSAPAFLIAFFATELIGPADFGINFFDTAPLDDFP